MAGGMPHRSPGAGSLKAFDDFEQVSLGAGEVHRVKLVVVVDIGRVPGTAVSPDEQVKYDRFDWKLERVGAAGGFEGVTARTRPDSINRRRTGTGCPTQVSRP